MHKIKEVEKRGVKFHVFIENEINWPKKIMINNEDCCEFSYGGYDDYNGVDLYVVKKGIPMSKELTDNMDSDIEILVDMWFDIVNSYKELGFSYRELGIDLI